MDRIIIVGLGGCFGSVLRYLVSGWAHTLLGERFPWGTLAVNVIGCFVLGALGSAAIEGQLLGPNARLFLFIGVIGGFTTFSAFGYETIALLEGGRILPALLSIGSNVGFGLAAVWLGASCGRTLVSR